MTDAAVIGEAFAAEPVLAWRAWNLARVREVPRLVPVGAERRPWPAGRSASARCLRRRRHAAPAPDCTCGFHGAKDVELLRRTRGPAVIGTIALWGRIIEHDLGYRSEFAYPQRLRLVCPICFWWRGPERADPLVVAVGRRGPMMPLCEEHLSISAACGFVVRHARPVTEVRAALLSTYAVDLLAA